MDNYLEKVELLRTRSKKLVLPIMVKALSLLFGTVTEGEIKIVRKLEQVEGN